MFTSRIQLFHAYLSSSLAYSCSSKAKVTDTADGKTKTPGDQVVELERLSSDEQAKASAAPAAQVRHSGSSIYFSRLCYEPFALR